LRVVELTAEANCERLRSKHTKSQGESKNSYGKDPVWKRSSVVERIQAVLYCNAKDNDAK
jgi:hypothetical protein